MKFLPKDTLAYHESAPQKKTANLSFLKLSKLSDATKAYRKTCGLNNPDIEALEFYALNHYYALISKKFTRNEQLPVWASGLCTAYSTTLTQQSERLMHYMISIITRECRHLYNPSATLEAMIEGIGGKKMVEFVSEIRGVNESEAVNKYMNSPPDVNCGPYVRAIEACFDSGKWSSSFGGKPWGMIARTLGDYLYGKTSLEMLVDTAYTLAHNNGPMFNKSMMYSMYSGSFKNILDIQRGGFIPELIKNKTKYAFIKGLSISVLESLNDLAYSHMGDEFDEDVDWQKIMDLGALGSYSHLVKDNKPAQEPKVSTVKPKKPFPTNEYVKTPAKTNVPQFVLFNGKAAKSKGLFEVSSGETVTIMERI